MEYESLLEEAYESVQPCECCDRFEVRKVEGHHEGSKTVVSNFGGVANCIGRSKEELMKFLFRELATSGELNGDRLILGRKISSKAINDKIHKYFNNFVVCSSCKKPDTEIVLENGKSFLRCMACGAKREVHNK